MKESKRHKKWGRTKSVDHYMENAKKHRHTHTQQEIIYLKIFSTIDRNKNQQKK